jgi:hypothetical protein
MPRSSALATMRWSMATRFGPLHIATTSLRRSSQTAITFVSPLLCVVACVFAFRREPLPYPTQTPTPLPLVHRRSITSPRRGAHPQHRHVLRLQRGKRVRPSLSDRTMTTTAQAADVGAVLVTLASPIWFV